MDRERVRRSGVMAVIATFALVVLAACGSGAGEVSHEPVTRVPVMSDAAAQATREAASGATPGAEGEAGATGDVAMEVTVTSNDIFFEPTELTIPANTNVKFILPNEGAAAHDFSIDELGIEEAIAPGDTKEVIVNAPAGTYEYYCSVPGHKQAGMVGTLTVTEDASAAPAASPAADAGATPVGTTGQATPEAAASVEATPGAATPVAEGAPAGQIQIVADDIFFAPEEVTIPADQDVTLTLRNEGVAAHNFSIDSLGIDVPLPPGEETEITINAPAGEYEYYCSEPGHKDVGMVGTLIVTGDAAATPEVSPEEGAPASEAAADADAAPAADTATVVSHDIYFEPKELTIPANTDVTVSLPNDGVTLHNFTIDTLGIDVDIEPGATEEVVINAPAGEYEFYCNVPGHKAAGMVGTLTVSGDGAATVSAPAEEAAPATAEEAAAPAADDAPAEEGAGASAEPVTVVSHDIFFDPKEISIPADTDVTVSLPNEGVTLHNFAIDELGIDVDIDPGATQEVVINAPAGEYEYYCNVPGHKAAGMVGTLTVG